MADTHVWRLIQSWMDGQVVRMNQSQVAEAFGVGRQSLSQWKAGATPSPKHLRAIRRVTRIDWNLLTDALLRDMGYVEEDPNDGTAIGADDIGRELEEGLSRQGRRRLDEARHQRRSAKS